jgi:Zn-dependent metalloprotease
LDRAALAVHRTQQPQRILQAQAHFAALRSQLGLGERDAFVARHAFTNPEGQAIVRLEQTHDGHRVWGGQAIAHVSPDGGIHTITKSVRGGIALEGEPSLSGDQALKIALARLAPKGPMKDAPQVERVVFPAQFLGGLASKVDPATGQPVLDRQLTISAKLEAPYVWAYEVRTRLRNDVDGHKELTFLIDGHTGKVLRIQDLVQHLDAITPAQGTGQGYYRGNNVPLNTTQMLDDSFFLMDTTRGAKPNPGLAWYSSDPTTGWDPTIPAMQVFYNINDADGYTTWQQQLFQNTVNTWGDGLPFTSWSNEGGANGQTAGVDAMSGMTTTWDFYQNVLGRNGMDGQGTAVVGTVLMTPSPYNHYYADNADWSVWSQSLQLGAGTYRQGNPNGLESLTDLDIVAHEMTHGVTSPSFSQYWVSGSGYEEAGLNEAASDFFAQMVKAYATREPGNDFVVPDTDGSDWQIGKSAGRGTPIRWMNKPSLDQRSKNDWFDGIRYMDGHFSAGPLNRAFFFMVHGASSSPADASYSPYLPGGMTGIGNDAAARIVYKAVTEFLIGDGTGSITFEDVREACLNAAYRYNYGYSHFIPAIQDAFAAANIGEAHNQVTPRTQVRFAGWRNHDYIELTHFSDYSNRQIFPKGETVYPRVSVLNNANTAVTWSLGGPSLFNGADGIVYKGGTLHADGSWTTPNVMGWHALTATSKADPNQFAEGRVFLIHMDTDMDGEIDALDMCGVSASWYLWGALNPAHSMFEAPLVDDGDISFFVDALKSTWPVK